MSDRMDEFGDRMSRFAKQITEMVNGALSEGYGAFLAGLDESDNPYAGTQLSGAWAVGYFGSASLSQLTSGCQGK